MMIDLRAHREILIMIKALACVEAMSSYVSSLRLLSFRLLT
jgi:hypothetical protein